MRIARTLFMPLALLVAGCALSAADEGEAGLRETKLGIVGGEPAPTRTSAVVIRFAFDETSDDLAICTGAMIAPDLVLTARHCVARVKRPTLCDAQGRDWDLWGNPRNSSEVGFGEGFPLASMQVSPQPSLEPGGEWEDAAGVTDVFHVDDPSVCRADVAVLMLDRKLEGVRPLPIAMRAPLPGDLLDILGYGVTEAGPAASGVKVARRERESVPVLRTGPREEDWFGPPVPVGFFQVGEAACYGDSGGPALDRRTGAILGVASTVANLNVDTSVNHGAASCMGDDARGYYSDLRHSRSALTAAFQAAGYDPWFEGESEPSWEKPAAALQTSRGGCTVTPLHVLLHRRSWDGWLLILVALAWLAVRSHRRTAALPAV